MLLNVQLNMSSDLQTQYIALKFTFPKYGLIVVTTEKAEILVSSKVLRLAFWSEIHLALS